MRVAIIGSGPAGFYAAEALLKRTDTVVHVDVFDRLPTPYGLVRAGVAPDHPDIKSVTRIYEATASRPTFRFLGNVRLGSDLTVADLRAHYHQIVYAVGSPVDRRLGIPGEGIAGSMPATVFVGWYNGHPDYRLATVNLSVPRVAVVGNGNVALDAARILLRAPAELSKTDIAGYALEALRSSQVREVFVLGRRGPQHASFTPGELKELGEMPGVDIVVDPADLAQAMPEPGANSQQDKNLRILRGYAERKHDGYERKLHFRFFVSPTEVLAGPTGKVSGLELERNRLERDADGIERLRPTGETSALDVGMVLPAVGYAAEPIPGVPYDGDARVVANEDGRVVDPASRSVVANEYVVGWARSGPQGLIGSHKRASAQVVAHMIADGVGLEARQLPDHDTIVAALRRRGVHVVSFDDWKALDDVEVARGERRGAPRDKLVDVAAMLALLRRPTVATS